MTVELRNRTKCRITEDITAAQTILPVGPGGAGFLPSMGNTTMAVLRDSTGFEVVAVTGAGIDTLAVERGQDGSTARAFKAGATVSMRLVKGGLVGFEQKGVMREVAYNPNGVLLPKFFGEKVAEVGADGCVHRVWQNIIRDFMSWRIVYGDICQDLINWRDWNWYVVEDPWQEWPWDIPPTPEPEPAVGNIKISGDLSCYSLLCSGDVACSGSLNVNNGDCLVNGNISVVQSFNCNGYAAVGGEMEVEYDINAYDGLFCAGGVKTNENNNGSLNINAGTIFAKFFEIGGSFSVSVDVTAVQSIVVKGDVYVGGDLRAASLTCPGEVIVVGQQWIG